jgi:hypothetical protein
MMKRLFFLGFLILFVEMTVSAQVIASDTTDPYLLVEQTKYFGRVFENLPAVQHSDTAYNPLLNEVCSHLAGCLAVLSINLLDSVGAKTVYARLQAMANQFYADGTPFILTHGYESMESARRLNQFPDKYGLKYFGDNSCITSGREDLGREVFNNKIYELVGYQKETTLETKKKRKR